MTVGGARATYVDEDVRLRILAELAQQQDEAANEHVLKAALEAWGHVKGRDYVRGQLQWLADMRAIDLRKIGDGEGVWIAALRSMGRDHVERRAKMPGVAPATRSDA